LAIELGQLDRIGRIDRLFDDAAHRGPVHLADVRRLDP
jgi:hypothetical protein